MKKLLLSLVSVTLLASVSFAQSFGTYSLETSLSKEDCMDRIDEWVALNLGSYSLNVDYKNEKTGRTIIKGRYVPSQNACYSVTKGAIDASIVYTIVTEAKDNECIVTFNDLFYCFNDGGYVDYSRIATQNLELMVSEMDEMESVGEKIEVTPEFLDVAAKVLDEYNSVADQLKDENLKKSERKKIDKTLSKMRGKRNVYYDVSMNSALFLKAIASSIEKSLK